MMYDEPAEPLTAPFTVTAQLDNYTRHQSPAKYNNIVSNPNNPILDLTDSLDFVDDEGS